MVSVSVPLPDTVRPIGVTPFNMKLRAKLSSAYTFSAKVSTIPFGPNVSLIDSGAWVSSIHTTLAPGALPSTAWSMPIRPLRVISVSGMMLPVS